MSLLAYLPFSCLHIEQRVYHAPALWAYGSVVSFKTRAEMIRQAASAYFNTRKAKQSTFSKKLGSLINEYIAYSGRRNEIAHGFLKNVLLLSVKPRKVIDAGQSASTYCPLFSTQRNSRTRLSPIDIYHQI